MSGTKKKISKPAGSRKTASKLPRRSKASASRGSTGKKKKLPRLELTGWATTDAEERLRRVRRGIEATDIIIKPMEASLAPYGRHLVESGDRQYYIELRGFEDGINTCTCPDFATNQLGTCKHIEAVLHRKHRQRNKRPLRRVSEIYLDTRKTPATITWHDLGTWQGDNLPEPLTLLSAQPVYNSALVSRLITRLDALPASQKRRWRLSPALLERAEHELEDLRIAQRVTRMLPRTTSNSGGTKQKGIDQGIKLPLYPYQRKGIEHLLRCRRAILADEMGLGKTVQAIAACAALHQLGLAERVLVVSPASLKTEWEEQIGIFTDLHSQVVIGSRHDRLQAYRHPKFFTLVNYEQVLRDSADINSDLAPDIIVLDEAQRIKNWRAKTAEAVKRLSSRYAFVLTGTPLENRIDEIYSIMQFIDPEILGPLFRFNREYYVLNERGNPIGYKHLDKLKQQLAPRLLRRSKDDVEGDLPPCTSRTILTSMTEEQSLRYADDESMVARIAARAKTRPLTPDESRILQLKLASMRMYCDSVYILDQSITAAPKLDELDKLLDELLAGKHKILVFSEWTRMLDLLRMRLDKRGIDYALHTGKVPQKKRRVEISRFKNDSNCRLFLSTESGGAGLNLQVADVVINLDLPWNPAKLSQRIARAWRKHQTRSVQVINLVAEHTIEHRMIGRLEAKQRLADAVLTGGLDSMELPSGRGAMLQQIEDLMGDRSLASDADKAEAQQNQDSQTPTPTAVAATEPASPANWHSLATQALTRFDKNLQHLELQLTDSGAVVIATARAESQAIRTYLEQQPAPSGMPFTVQVIDPALREQLDGLIAAGIISINGRTQELINKGRVTAREPRPAALRKAVAPYLKSAQAAALLESSGFAEQASALVKGFLPDLLDALHRLQDSQALPDALLLQDWSLKAPRAESLLSALTQADQPG